MPIEHGEKVQKHTRRRIDNERNALLSPSAEYSYSKSGQVFLHGRLIIRCAVE